MRHLIRFFVIWLACNATSAHATRDLAQELQANLGQPGFWEVVRRLPDDFDSRRWLWVEADDDEQTIVMHAASAGAHEAILVLLNLSPDFAEEFPYCALDGNRHNVMHHAAVDLATATALLSSEKVSEDCKNEALSQVDLEGQTPAELARFTGHDDVAAFLDAWQQEHPIRAGG